MLKSSNIYHIRFKWWEIWMTQTLDQCNFKQFCEIAVQNERAKCWSVLGTCKTTFSKHIEFAILKTLDSYVM